MLDHNRDGRINATLPFMPPVATASPAMLSAGAGRQTRPGDLLS